MDKSLILVNLQNVKILPSENVCKKHKLVPPLSTCDNPICGSNIRGENQPMQNTTIMTTV